MILHVAPTVEGDKTSYKMAETTTPGVDDDGIEITVVDWYTLPGTRVNVLGEYQGKHVIEHNPDTPEVAARLEASTEYLDANQETLRVRAPEIYEQFVTVEFGTPDDGGVYQSMPLAQYLAEGRPRSEIRPTPSLPPRYFRAE